MQKDMEKSYLPEILIAHAIGGVIAFLVWVMFLLI